MAALRQALLSLRRLFRLSSLPLLALPLTLMLSLTPSYERASMLLDRSNLDATELSVPLAPGRYFWRLASIAKGDDEGPFGDAQHFEQLPVPPTPALQAPEIDGCVYLSGGSALPGEFRRVRITQASDYDLVGELDDDSTGAPALPEQISLTHRASDGRRVLRTYR